MAFVLFLLVLVVVGVVVWRRRAEGPAKPAGLVPSLVDQGRDLLAPLYPSRPLNRRTLPRRLLRAAEQTVTIGVSGTVLVPSRIEISVNPEDLEPFTDALEWLRRDVGEALRLRAEANGWVVPSGPEVTIVADPDRPMRLPRAVGRLDAFHPEDIRTPPLPPPPDQPGRPRQPEQPGPRPDPPGPEPATAHTQAPAPPELTGRTSVVVGDNATHDGADEPTVAVRRSFHLRLVAEGEPTGGGPVDLNALLVAGAPLVMGRSREADLQVRNRQVSGRHCALSVDPDEGPVTIEDLGSTNGTFVDGQRVDRAPLLPGASLRLGESSWRVELDPVNAA
jgi:FHA domain/Protein of unknown function (DUF3662)